MYTAAMSTTTSKRVRPKDAASLVIVRGRGAAAEVLLGRREPGHRFVPDFYVFPGGRVDPADAARPTVSELSPSVEARLMRQASARRARALAVAAVRETFEETGLVVGKREGESLRPALGALGLVARAITPPESPIRFHARFFMVDAANVGGRLSGNGELLDLRWVRLNETANMDLIDVTEFVIGEVSRRLRGEEPPGFPRFSYRRGQPFIRYE